MRLAVAVFAIGVLFCGLCSAKKLNHFREKYRNRKYRHSDNTCELEIKCRGGVPKIGAGPAEGEGRETPRGVPITLPIRGPRGPAGRDGQPGPPGNEGLPGMPGTPGKNAGGRKIAFFVGQRKNLGPFSKDTDVQFDNVITNVGSAYDRVTGRFTSPVDATYQFNVVISAQGRQKAGVMIMKNGEMVTTVWAESIPFWASASSVVVLSLRRTDVVWLRVLGRASYLHGYMYSTFSGVIVFEN